MDNSLILNTIYAPFCIIMMTLNVSSGTVLFDTNFSKILI